MPRQRGITPRYRARHAQQRLPAAERRQALLAAAERVFAEGSYSGATTADIARAAGVSEPILYRHFPSKRDLYLAVLEASWHRLRDAWTAALEHGAPDPGLLFRVVRELKKDGVVPSLLWMQALTEAGEDPHIRRYMRRHLHEVHDYVAGVLRQAQAAGTVGADRDADAEAWIFVAGALLYSVSARLGGLLTDEELLAISRARASWLSS